MALPSRYRFAGVRALDDTSNPHEDPRPSRRAEAVRLPHALIMLACGCLMTGCLPSQGGLPAAREGDGVTSVAPPFTVGDLRGGIAAGRRLDFRVVRPSGRPSVSSVLFTVADANGVEMVITALDETGHEAGRESVRASWIALRDRIPFPGRATVVSEERLVIDAGTYRTQRYVVTDGDTVSTYWFAKSVMPLPLCTTIVRAGRLLERRELFRDIL